MFKKPTQSTSKKTETVDLETPKKPLSKNEEPIPKKLKKEEPKNPKKQEIKIKKADQPVCIWSYDGFLEKIFYKFWEQYNKVDEDLLYKFYDFIEKEVDEYNTIHESCGKKEQTHYVCCGSFDCLPCHTMD
jgi:hypothetical protein